uniref:Uncharacterized protein n=1 Tax=Rhizophora mucronata TaxID=61149 RepID=A0A2P2R4W9_RHIMU
MYKIHFYD